MGSHLNTFTRDLFSAIMNKFVLEHWPSVTGKKIVAIEYHPLHKAKNDDKKDSNCAARMRYTSNKARKKENKVLDDDSAKSLAVPVRSDLMLGSFNSALILSMAAIPSAMVFPGARRR